ncbi:MAG: polyhydroxyalkanoate synthesis regulator DNA-binding domain-containing protein [Nannocystales bacterium]
MKRQWDIAAHSTEFLGVTIIKKYSNRRLYDTGLSRYITLDELATKIRDGEEVRVVDAKSGDDLTQMTLTQLILESPTAKLLPVGLLHRLLRMQDDAIAEFFSSYVTWALDVYLSVKSGGQTLGSMLPFGSGPWGAGGPFARMFAGAPFWPGQAPPASTPSPPTAPPPPPTEQESPSVSDDLQALRAELEELKRAVRGGDDAT